MRIIICGAGRVGQGIAQRLSLEHDVTIVDENADLVDQVAANLEVRGVVGHASHPSVLKSAGAENAEMIIAVTHADEVNMVTCQVAHSLFKVTTKIARIRSQAYLKAEYANLFSQAHMPIDLCISPEVEVGQSILQRLKLPGAFLTQEFANGVVTLVGAEAGDKFQIFSGPLKDMKATLDENSVKIVGLGRDKKFISPNDLDVIEKGDRVYWVVPTSNLDHTLSVFDQSFDQSQVQHVVIVGAGNIGLYVARELEKHRNIRVRVIENCPARAELAAESLKRAIVLNGDGLNPELLEEAGAVDADVILGLTSDDKTNLLLGALAKRKNAKRVIALVNDSDLREVKSSVGVDVIVDPRAVTVSRILLEMRQGRLSNLLILEEGAAEVVEGVAKETTPLIGKKLTETLPEGVIAGALIRDNEVIELTERVRPNDLLVLMMEKEMARKVDQLFRVKPEFY